MQAVRRLSAQWPVATLKLVEDKANGPAVIQSLRHEIGGLVEVTPEGGKMSRAVAASPQLESGNWYLPHPLLKPWVEGFLAGIPLGAEYGDRGLLISVTERRTRALIDTIASVTPRPLRTLVNTHHHGDHTHGNYLMPAATIIKRPSIGRP